MTVFVAIILGAIIFVVAPIFSYDVIKATMKQLREEFPNKSEEEFKQIETRIITKFGKIWLTLIVVYLFILFLYFIRPLF